MLRYKLPKLSSGFALSRRSRSAKTRDLGDQRVHPQSTQCMMIRNQFRDQVSCSYHVGPDRSHIFTCSESWNTPLTLEMSSIWLMFPSGNNFCLSGTVLIHLRCDMLTSVEPMMVVDDSCAHGFAYCLFDAARAVMYVTCHEERGSSCHVSRSGT